MKKTAVLVFFLLFFWLGGPVTSSLSLFEDSSPSQTIQKENPAAPVSVEVGTPERRALNNVLEIPASLAAYEEADLFGKTSGYISKVLVDIGDRVGKGKALLEIEVPEMLDELRQKEAELAALRTGLKALAAEVRQVRRRIEVVKFQAEIDHATLKLESATLKRQKELFQKKAASAQEMDEYQNRYDSARVRVAVSRSKIEREQGELEVLEARIQAEQTRIPVVQAAIGRIRTLMKYAVIRAPFPGVITRRAVHPGDFVRSAVEGDTTSLLSIARTDRLRVVMDISESEFHYIQKGMPVELRVPGRPGKLSTVKISRFAGALDTSTRTMRAEADLFNPPGEIKPGMYVKAVVQLQGDKKAVMIPSKSVREKGGNYFAWIVEDNTVKETALKLGHDNGIWVEILAGLETSDRVVLSAPNGLRPGARVKPVPAKGEK